MIAERYTVLGARPQQRSTGPVRRVAVNQQ
jgi:hypothetical protein